MVSRIRVIVSCSLWRPRPLSVGHIIIPGKDMNLITCPDKKVCLLVCTTDGLGCGVEVILWTLTSVRTELLL